MRNKGELSKGEKAFLATLAIVAIWGAVAAVIGSIAILSGSVKMPWV